MGETFMVEGGEGLKAAERANLELEGPGMSDLISSAWEHAGHSASSCTMALSSGLRSGRAPEKHVNDEELEISITSKKLYRKQSDTHVDSPGWSKPPETPRVSSLSSGSYSQLRPLTKK